MPSVRPGSCVNCSRLASSGSFSGWKVSYITPARLSWRTSEGSRVVAHPMHSPLAASLSLSRAGRLINSEASANGPHESPLDWWSLSFARHIPGEALSWPARRWPKHHLHSLLITLSFLAFYTFVGRALRMARPSARR